MGPIGTILASTWGISSGNSASGNDYLSSLLSNFILMDPREIKIQFAQKMIIKGHDLNDFIVDSIRNGFASAMDTPAETTLRETPTLWELYSDGLSSKDGSGTGLVVMP